MKITREDVKQFPRFISHDSARSFFRSIYGTRFCMSDISYNKYGEKVYSYSVVLDKDRYLEWRDKLMKLEPVNDYLYLDTFQHCEITERGKLTVYFDHPYKQVKEV